MDAQPAQPTREKRRILVVFALGIVFPTFFLTWLSSIAVRNDGAAMTRLAEEQSRSLANEFAKALRLDLREAEVAARLELDRTVLETGSQDSLELLAEVLEGAKARHPIVRGYFAVDENRNVLIPSVRVPYERERGDAGLAAPDTDRELEAIFGPGGEPPSRPPDAGEEEGSLEEAIRAYEQLQADKRALEAAFDLEIRREDPGAAAGAYEELVGEATDPRTRGRALAGLGRCLYKVGNLPRALETYAQLAALPHEVYENELPLRVLARLQRGYLLGADGQLAAAVDALVELAHDLERGRYELVKRDYDYFAGKTHDLVGRTIARIDADERSPPALRARLAEASDELRQIRARAIETSRRVEFVERIVEGEIVPYLGILLDDPEGVTEGFTHFSKRGENPLLVHYAILSRTGDPVTRLLVGFVVDIDWLGREVARRRAASMLTGPGVSISLLDQQGAEVAHVGPPRSGGDLAVAVPIEDTLPFWQVRVARDGKGIAAERRRRATLYLGIVATAVLAVLVGAYSAFRAVTKTLELARLKSDFVSAVTHELRTPLTSIRMFAEMLAMGRVRSDDKRQQYFSIIANESERLGSLIDNILDFARLEKSGKRDFNFEVLDPVPFVERALEIFAFHVENKGFDIVREIPPEGTLPRVQVDRGTMTRAILNLLSNAMKYSGEAREIALRVGRGEPGEVTIAVTDRGVGIPPEHREKIFERFYRAGSELTREVPGTGLGLAIVLNIIEAHDGRIEVESEVGRGSTFTIVLPEAGPAPEPPPAAEAEAEAPADEADEPAHEPATSAEPAAPSAEEADKQPVASDEGRPRTETS